MSLQKILLILVFTFSFLMPNNDALSDKNNITLDDNKKSSLAWKLSIVPGLGQFYNQEYLKGIFIFSSEAALLRNISLHSANIAMRNSLIWWALGIYVYNIIDAYVDAELSTFTNNKNKDK